MVGPLFKDFRLQLFIVYYITVYFTCTSTPTHTKLGTFHLNLADLPENGNQVKTCWMVIKYSCDL